MLRIIFSAAIFIQSIHAQSNGETFRDYEKADRAMQSAHTKLTESLNDSWHEENDRKTLLAKIAESQKAWAAWLELESDISGNLDSGGSGRLHRFEAFSFKVRETEKRTKYLIALAGGEIVEEPQVLLIQPQRDNPLRKTLCNAFRPSVEKDIGVKNPIFVIHSLRAMGDWAFIHCTPKNPNGSDINWNKTKYGEDMMEMDDIAVGLLQKNADDEWKVKSFGVGATDVWWLGWIEEYGIPELLLQDPR